jgi:hypothetical protein
MYIILADTDTIPSALSVLLLYFPFTPTDNARLYAAVRFMERWLRRLGVVCGDAHKKAVRVRYRRGAYRDRKGIYYLNSTVKVWQQDQVGQDNRCSDRLQHKHSVDWLGFAVGAPSHEQGDSKTPECKGWKGEEWYHVGVQASKALLWWLSQQVISIFRPFVDPRATKKLCGKVLLQCVQAAFHS